MREEPGTSGVTVVVVIAALVLLCGGCGAVGALFGFGFPAALVGRAVTAPPAPPSRTPASYDLEGTWVRGVGGLDTYRVLPVERWTSPQHDGQRYVFRADGTCERDFMASTALNDDCGSWVYLSARACTWSLDGDALSLTLGEGLQRARDCQGAFNESVSTPRSLRLTVSLVGGKLVLHDTGGLRLEFERAAPR